MVVHILEIQSNNHPEQSNDLYIGQAQDK